MRYATIILTATVLATVAALSVSVLEPKRAEAASSVRACGGNTIQLNAKEARTYSLHNRVRKNLGLRPLCVHPKLTRAARAHSADMVRKDCYAHGSVGPRLKRYDYHWRACSENIGGGHGSSGPPRAVFRRWMDSSAHRANVLDRRFREVGIGTATGKYKGHKGYTMYTVDFGTRR